MSTLLNYRKTLAIFNDKVKSNPELQKKLHQYLLAISNLQTAIHDLDVYSIQAKDEGRRELHQEVLKLLGCSKTENREPCETCQTYPMCVKLALSVYCESVTTKFDE